MCNFVPYNVAACCALGDNLILRSTWYVRVMKVVLASVEHPTVYYILRAERICVDRRSWLQPYYGNVGTSAIGHGLLHAGRATGLTGTESGGSLDQTESVARWSRARRRTFESGMHESHGGTWKVCFRGVGNNRSVLFWLSGRAIDSGGQKRGFKSPRLCFFCFFFFVGGAHSSGIRASPTVVAVFFVFFAFFFTGVGLITMRSDSELYIFIFRSEKRIGLPMQPDSAKSDGTKSDLRI